MQWDFWTLSPESAHQVTWLMGDRGIPKTYRHMNGYSSHTYMWINGGGERFWVKYHVKTDQGIEYLTQAEADELAGQDADKHRRDLYESIESGNAPSWSLKVILLAIAIMWMIRLVEPPTAEFIFIAFSKASRVKISDILKPSFTISTIRLPER
jgi:hypothetical protein